MLQQEKIFGLTQLASSVSEIKVREDEQRIVDYAVTNQVDLLMLICQSGQVVTIGIEDNDLTIPSSPYEPEESVHTEHVRKLPWFSSDELRPKCVAFSPENDFVLLATENGHLFVMPTTFFSPKFCAKGKKTVHEQKTVNFTIHF